MVSVPSTYKALVYEKYGSIEDVLQLRDVPKEPLEPTFVRIQVHSAALNPADYKIVEGAGLHLLKSSPSEENPFRLGFDAAGVVVEVGSQVGGKFKVGDAVYAMPAFTGMTTLAEYLAIDAKYVALKPTTLDFSEAAAVPAVSLTSYQGLTDLAKLAAGERLLVIGGSTSVGMYTIQHAKMLGVYVIATASTAKVDFVKSLGADEVIDYTTTKWSDVVVPHSLDVIYDTISEPECWDKDAQIALKKDSGRYVTVIPGAPTSEPKFGATHSSVFCYPSGAQLTEIAGFIDAGKIKPVIDSVFPFERSVEALSKVKTGRVLGKVVIEIQPSQPVEKTK